MEWIDINEEQPQTEGKYVVKTTTTMGNTHKVEAPCTINEQGKASFGVSGQIVTHWLKEDTEMYTKDDMFLWAGYCAGRRMMDPTEDATIIFEDWERKFKILTHARN